MSTGTRSTIILQQNLSIKAGTTNLTREGQYNVTNQQRENILIVLKFQHAAQRNTIESGSPISFYLCITEQFSFECRK